eukprot:1460954-Amphidinium_carterae.1
MNRPPPEQTTPLTLDQVQALEILQANPERNEHKLILGYLLTVLHVRCRFSNAMTLQREPTVDSEGAGLLEMTSVRTKTNLVGGRRIPVPLVGLGNGVSDRPWATAWLVSRGALQLSGSNPLCPRLSRSGVFGAEPTKPSDGAAWLTIEGQRLGSHTLKATLLSWAAKWG